MTQYQWLCLFGIPTLLTAQVTYLIKRVKDTAKKTNAIAAGVQALLRTQLRQESKRCHKQGYATLNDRDDFENCWAQYHALGANGVMDDVRKKFFDLPIGGEEQ